MDEQKEENKSMKDILLEIRDQQKEVTDKKKEKKFRLPWSARVGKAKLKKGYATFLYVNENREWEFFKTQIDEGAIKKNDNFHTATAEYGMTYKGKPAFIIPSWDIEPFCPQKNLNEAQKAERTTMGQRYVFNKMKMDAITDKKKGMSPAMLIGGLAVLAIVGYIATQGKLF